MEFIRAQYSRRNLIEAGKMLAAMHKPQTKKEHRMYSLETLRVADRFDRLIGNGGSYCRDTYFADYMRAIDNKDESKKRLDDMFRTWRREAIGEINLTLSMLDKGEVDNLDMI